MSIRVKWLFVALLGALLPGLGLAEEEVAPQAGQVYLNVLGGFYDGPDELDIVTGDEALGGGLGWMITDRWALEGLYFDFEPEVEVGGVRARGDTEYWTANVLRHFRTGRMWQPYLTFGAGRAEFLYQGLQLSDEDTVYNGGVGLRTRSGRVQFRAALRGLYYDDADDWSPMATAGLSFFLGGRAPAPAPAPVAAAPVDSDGDGVSDGSDRCPGTPMGVAVDPRGCPLDSDGDGVPDYQDQCPGTPSGARVDERGCEIVVAEPVSFDLTVTFGFDSAEITGVAFQEMLRLLRFLREYPSTTAVIEGHTDDRGAADYNLDLSERRAEAVREALTNSGIDASRLTARGYGETRPIAGNDSEAGRQQNRRVTVVVSGTSG